MKSTVSCAWTSPTRCRHERLQGPDDGPGHGRVEGRVRNLLMDFALEEDINVVIDFSPTEVWPGSGLAEATL